MSGAFAPSSSKRLRSNFVALLVSNSVYSLCQWVVLIAIVKYTTTATVGLYSLSLAIAAPVFMFTNMQLRNFLATETDEVNNFASYLRLRVVLSMSAFLLLICIYWIWAFDGALGTLLIIIAGAKAIEAISDIYQGLFQKNESMHTIARSMTLRGVLSVICVGAILKFTGNIVLATLAMTGSWLLVLIMHDVPASAFYGEKSLVRIIRIRDLITLKRSVNWGLLRLCLPLGVGSLIISLTASMPRFLVDKLLGIEEVGLYAAVAYFMISSQIAGSAIAFSMSARLGHFAKTDQCAFRDLIMKGTIICGAIGVLGILMALLYGKPILQLFYGEKYSNLKELFFWIMVANALNLVFWPCNMGLLAARMIWQLLMVRIIALMSVTVCCIVLLKQHGLVGVAWALSVGFLLQFGVGNYQLRRRRNLVALD